MPKVSFTERLHKLEADLKITQSALDKKNNFELLTNNEEEHLNHFRKYVNNLRVLKSEMLAYGVAPWLIQSVNAVIKSALAIEREIIRGIAQVICFLALKESLKGARKLEGSIDAKLLRIMSLYSHSFEIHSLGDEYRVESSAISTFVSKDAKEVFRTSTTKIFDSFRITPQGYNYATEQEYHEVVSISRVVHPNHPTQTHSAELSAAVSADITSHVHDKAVPSLRSRF